MRADSTAKKLFNNNVDDRPWQNNGDSRCSNNNDLYQTDSIRDDVSVAIQAQARKSGLQVTRLPVVVYSDNTGILPMHLSPGTKP